MPLGAGEGHTSLGENEGKKETCGEHVVNMQLILIYLQIHSYNNATQARV